MEDVARALPRGKLGVADRDELAPAAEDTVLRKFRYDAFYGTPLDHLLRLWGIDTLVICGTLANITVHYTAASAALRWYAVVIPRDAISSLEPFDLEASLRQTAFVLGGRLTPASGVRCRDSLSGHNAQARSADPSLEML